MSRIFPIVVKRVTNVTAAASASWLARLLPGLSFVPSVTGTVAKPTVAPGVALTQAPARMTSALSVGRSLAASVSGTVRPTVQGGPQLGARLDAKPAVTLQRGLELVHTKIDLTGTYGAASAVNTTVSGAAWTNPTNAQGAKNGTLSSHAGSATSAQDAHLTFTPPAVTGKDALTLTKVEAWFWISQTGTTLANGNLRLWTGTAANPEAVLHLTTTGNIDNLTTPLVYDITSRFSTWASLSDFRARVRHTSTLGQTHTGNVDAVELVVTATRTDLL